VLYKEDFMVIFGGIHSVTKELDDLCVLDLKLRKWFFLQDDKIFILNRQANTKATPYNSDLIVGPKSRNI